VKRRKSPVILPLLLVAVLLAGIFFLSGRNSNSVTPEDPEIVDPGVIDPLDEGVREDGIYTSKEELTAYLIEYGKLPQNFMTKKEAREYGWESGGLDDFAYGMCIGGDDFSNYEKKLPTAEGRKYYVCDVDTLHADSRGSKRIVYSNDGLIYYTDNNYETFVLLYGGAEDDPQPAVPVTPEETEEADDLLDADGTYTSKEDVALYLYQYGELPQNFMTKKEAQKLGWEGGGLDDYAYGMCIGGDVYGNYEGLLPKKKGRTYYECDIDTLHKKSRGAKRIVFSSDGLIYYTKDHYEHFELLYGEE